MTAVTVLVAAGNDAAAMEVTARSLLAQNLTDFELLVMDEGAADLADLAAMDARVRVVRTEAVGLGAVLNHGVELAQGELIARAAPGDVSAPGRLARQAALLGVSSELAFVATGWCSVAADGSVHRVVTPPAGDAPLRAAMADGDAIGHPTAMMRRDAVIKAGGMRPAFVGLEDYDLLLRLMDRHAGACVPEVLVEFQAPEEVVGWRELEQRILSEMAAVAARDRRQVGRPDHGERNSPVDREVLHRMGMVADEIAQNLVARALSAAVAAGSAGQWRGMREAARLGLQQDGLPGRLRSQFLALWLRSVARVRPVGNQPLGAELTE